MARRVFFSFHYERDIWRASIVRKSWITREPGKAGFWDASLWEKAKKTGKAALQKLINDALEGTSVTAVLIGAHTSRRRWVKYEIAQSIARGNGLLGIYIHKILDSTGEKDLKGDNPFKSFRVPTLDGRSASAASVFATYDWVTDDGYTNLKAWVEAAAQQAGKSPTREHRPWWQRLDDLFR